MRLNRIRGFEGNVMGSKITSRNKESPEELERAVKHVLTMGNSKREIANAVLLKTGQGQVAGAICERLGGTRQTITLGKYKDGG